MTQSARLEAAKEIARDAGALGLSYFKDISKLEVKDKTSAHDMVSNADLEVETYVRKRIAEAFPEDGIVGEEHAPKDSQSGWTWVIDPIDGTANFVRGIPQWCVILACVHEDETKVGVMFEPSYGEMFEASKDGGAMVNDQPMKVAVTGGLNDGSIGVGFNGRTAAGLVPAVIDDLTKRGGIFFRNASGGLMLAYVAAGRLLGYTEPHMNAWDCLAGQLMIKEAGGRIETQSAGVMLKSGGRVIAGSPDIYDELLEMSEKAYS